MSNLDFRIAMGKLLAPLYRKISLLISRGAVKKVDDSLNCQNLQLELTDDELHDEIEHIQPYGYTSYPKTDAEVVFVSVGGQRSHGLVLSVADRRYRPKNMAEGDVCLHGTKGERVYIEDAGDIVNLGAKAAADFVALAGITAACLAELQADVNGLKQCFAAWTPVPNDGGAALKVLTSASWETTPLTEPTDPAASKVKAT